MKVLGLDYGEKRIGVSIADTAVPVAVPRGTLSNDDEFITSLSRLRDEEQIERIVVGLPLTLRGEEGEMAKTVRAFGDMLQKKLELPIEFVDERLSTRSAQGAEDVDAAAATIILQAWLDRRLAPRSPKGEVGSPDEGGLDRQGPEKTVQ